VFNIVMKDSWDLGWIKLVNFIYLLVWRDVSDELVRSSEGSAIYSKINTRFLNVHSSQDHNNNHPIWDSLCDISSQ